MPQPSFESIARRIVEQRIEGNAIARIAYSKRNLMPEPDFDQIVRRAMAEINECAPGTRLAEVPTLFAFGPIKRALEEVWNARGELDLATVDATLTTLMGSNASGPYVKQIDRAIKGLDR